MELILSFQLRKIHKKTPYWNEFTKPYKTSYMFFLQNNYLYEEDPSSGILEEKHFALQSTHHITLHDMTGQLML